MEDETRQKERRGCGKCRWYDPLCDLCERPGGPCKEPELERWERDSGAHLSLSCGKDSLAVEEELYASLVYGASLDDAVSVHADDLGGSGSGYLHQGAKKRLRRADSG